MFVVPDGKFGIFHSSQLTCSDDRTHVEYSERATGEITKLNLLLAQMDSKIDVIIAEIQQKSQHQDGPSASDAMKNENSQLKAEVADMRTQARSLTAALLQ
ncbi:hypothetical protein RND71_008260 [Anisodus tanguticus]|uniref:Uncharacterized protein n=1 Tax=Anisodus tanguticus TaxID=243964 RepID=A0AAE1SQI1_9SOLA|nr:hypothetical protein RND71_008260 [Anisodus tanguticus]